MKLTVSIKAPSGEVRTFEDDTDWTDTDTGTAAEHAIWQWTDGNFGCDCNRAMFFADVAGEPNPGALCNTVIPTFKIRLRDEAGNVIHSEFEDT